MLLLVLRGRDPVAGVRARDLEEPYAEEEKRDCLGERDGLQRDTRQEIN